jgi:hypothetical protein
MGDRFRAISYTNSVPTVRIEESQKTNIPIAAPNITNAVTPTTVRSKNELLLLMHNFWIAGND